MLHSSGTTIAEHYTTIPGNTFCRNLMAAWTWYGDVEVFSGYACAALVDLEFQHMSQFMNDYYANEDDDYTEDIPF